MSLKSRLTNLRHMILRTRRERELDEELKFHLAERERELAEGGLYPHDAHHAAKRKFGNVTAIKEESRQSWTFSPLDTTLRDITFSFRLMRKQKWMSAVVILSLGIGIGMNTALLTLVNGVLLRPPPLYRDADRLVIIKEWSPKRPEDYRSVSWPVFDSWKQQSNIPVDLGIAGPVRAVSFRRDAFPLSVLAQTVSSELFQLAGVEPAIGRIFRAEDHQPGAERVVLLTHFFWQQNFDSDRNVVGRQIWLDGESYSVIGVMPERFYLIMPRVAMWTPLIRPVARPDQADRSLLMIGKLKAGKNIEDVSPALVPGLRQAEKQYPKDEQGWNLKIVPVVGQDLYLGGMAHGFWVLSATVFLSLLIACTNIATVMAARWTARQKETAVRLALGAGRARLLRQFLTESLLFSILGGLVAILFTFGGMRGLLAIAPPEARFFDFAIDLRILAFTAGLTLLTGLLSGMAPALVDTKRDLAEDLKSGQGRGTTHGVRQGLRTFLVISEVAVTTVLLVTTGALIQGYRALNQPRLLFDSRNLLLFAVELDESKYAERSEVAGRALSKLSPRAVEFEKQILASLKAMPGVDNASLTLWPPVSDAQRTQRIFLEQPGAEASGQPMEAGYNAVTPEYFEVLRVPMLQGRAFTGQDDSKAPAVVIVNSSFVYRYFPKSNALGSYLWTESAPDSPPRQIVGIVSDYANRGALQPPGPAFYLPHAQQPLEVQGGGRPALARVEFLVRTHTNAADLGDGIRGEVAKIDPFQAVGRIATVDQLLAMGAEELLVGIGLQAPLVGFAFLLTMMGIYGALAFSVTRRMPEFGIRMALGADAGHVRRVVLRQGLRLAAAGLVVGTALSIGMLRLLGSLIPMMRSVSWEVFVPMAAIVLLISAGASYLPARRATLADPLKALRAE